MIILGLFFLFLHKNVCCGYLLKAPDGETEKNIPDNTAAPP